MSEYMSREAVPSDSEFLVFAYNMPLRQMVSDASAKGKPTKPKIGCIKNPSASSTCLPE